MLEITLFRWQQTIREMTKGLNEDQLKQINTSRIKNEFRDELVIRPTKDLSDISGEFKVRVGEKVVINVAEGVFDESELRGRFAVWLYSIPQNRETLLEPVHPRAFETLPNDESWFYGNPEDRARTAHGLVVNRTVERLVIDHPNQDEAIKSWTFQLGFWIVDHRDEKNRKSSWQGGAGGTGSAGSLTVSR